MQRRVSATDTAVSPWKWWSPSQHRDNISSEPKHIKVNGFFFCGLQSVLDEAQGEKKKRTCMRAANGVVSPSLLLVLEIGLQSELGSQPKMCARVQVQTATELCLQCKMSTALVLYKRDSFFAQEKYEEAGTGGC